MNTPTNTPSVDYVYDQLQAVLAMLQALPAETINSPRLVPMIKAVKSIDAYSAALVAQIEARAIGNGELIPGVVVKDQVKHRQWTEPETAAQLAREALGASAFEPESLKSPAQIEKLGELGKSFVALASFKPEAGKKAVY